MVVSNESYEELRKRRMEENKRRMEELHLHQLTQALKPTKPPPMKRTQRRKIVTEMVEVKPCCKQACPCFQPKSQDSSRSTAMISSRSTAMIKAEGVRSSLGTEHPSCIKRLKGHVLIAYDMAFPTTFWKLFVLPKVDSEMVIEDENGEIHHVKYKAKICRLTAGWRKFVAEHNLLVGDVLVFHLVEPYRFKVYIVRANDPEKEDDLITRLNLEALSKPNLPFQELVAFKDFHVMVNGVCIDSELPDDVKMNYFKLCKDRKEFLHDCLPEKFYHKLVAGMIGEIVNIANEINNFKLTTTKEELDAWDNTLRSFSQMGMKVGFLRQKIATRV
ncbi:putative transcription factor B3-Domain family [Helianthus annuus]|nr:putative transcription factor B3-Domain family [Helianthus annuus]